MCDLELRKILKKCTKHILYMYIEKCATQSADYLEHNSAYSWYSIHTAILKKNSPSQISDASVVDIGDVGKGNNVLCIIEEQAIQTSHSIHHTIWQAGEMEVIYTWILASYPRTTNNEKLSLVPSLSNSQFFILQVIKIWGLERLGTRQKKS